MEAQGHHPNEEASSSSFESVEKTDISPGGERSSPSYVSRTMIGILCISAVVALSWCVMGISAVGWPSGTQLHVIRINLTLCALALFAMAAAVETLCIYTLVHPPPVLGIAYDEWSSWSVYASGSCAFLCVLLAAQLARLLIVAGKEQELNVLHTRLSRRSAGANSSSSSSALSSSSLSSSSSSSSSSRARVGIVSSRAETNATRFQRTLSSLHTAMFVTVPLSIATIVFAVYTYNLALPSIAEAVHSQLLLTSSILSFAAPIFQCVSWVTCYQWHRRILDAHDSDLYSKHTHIYEPVV